jgi:hypothetical protein
MKRARRYAATFLLTCLYLGLTPLALLHAFLDCTLDRFDPYIESLEVIANDDPEQPEIAE